MNWDDGTQLYHHGIKGQRWGIRRYQNKDGSLTPAGKKRYSLDNVDLDDASKRLEKASDFLDAASKEQGKVDHYIYTKKIKADLENMSDDELKQVVNRLNMEERYAQVMRSREEDLGKSAVGKWLEAAGTVVTVASSALSLAVAIKQLRG